MNVNPHRSPNSHSDQGTRAFSIIFKDQKEWYWFVVLRVYIRLWNTSILMAQLRAIFMRGEIQMKEDISQTVYHRRNRNNLIKFLPKY